MLTEADATIISRTRTPWPEAKDYPPPTPLEARSSAMKLLASGLFALLLAGMIALVLRENAQTPEAYEGWRFWLRVLIVIGVAGLGVTLLAAGIGAIMNPTPLVALGPEGLFVPSLYARTLPWSNIVLAVHERPRLKMLGTGRIVMAVRDGELFGRTGSTDLKAAGAAGGLDAVQLPQILDVPIEGLFARIQGYRAHFGQSGSPPTAA